MTTHVIQLRVGSTSSELISQEEEAFFCWLTSKLCLCEQNVVKTVPQRTIPITNEEIHNDGGRNAYVLIQNALDKISEFSESDTLIIDLEVRKISQIRMHLLIHILSGIESKLRTIVGFLPKNIVFITESLIPESDQAYRHIKSLMELTSVIIFDRDGECNNTLYKFQTEFTKRRILSKKHPRHSVAKKMVRQLGHFQKFRGEEKRCVRHFYDGKYCEKEIADYLYIELIDEVSTNTALCFDSKLSPWLVNSVLSLQSRLGCKFIDFSRERVGEGIDKYFLVLDFLDTGKTLVDRINLENTDPSRIISIVATDDSVQPNGRRFISRHGKTQLEVEYLIKAEIEMLPRDSCYLCNIGVPFDQLESLSMTGPLRSIDFWQMAIESGVADEEDPPSYRGKIDSGISTLGILKKNGGFLATRIAQLLDELNLSMDVSIICPENEKVSAVFTMYLELMLSKDVICIPRDVIDRFSRGAKEFAPGDRSAEWYARLTTPSVNKCVVIDDLSVSGDTITGICSVLKKLDKQVEGVFPFISYAREICSIQPNAVIPLYEWCGESRYA